MNKALMKHVQQQLFLFKTVSRMTEMFPKTLFSFCLFDHVFLAGFWRLK